MTTTMTRDEALSLTAALRAAGLGDVSVRVTDCVTPENTVAQCYEVLAVIRDDRHGNTVVRALRAPADAQAVAREMAREVRERAKGTRTRLRAERNSERS